NFLSSFTRKNSNTEPIIPTTKKRDSHQTDVTQSETVRRYFNPGKQIKQAKEKKKSPKKTDSELQSLKKQLEQEIAEYKESNRRLKEQIEEIEFQRAGLVKERSEFKKYREEEQEKFEKYKEEELKKINKARRVIERQARANALA